MEFFVNIRDSQEQYFHWLEVPAVRVVLNRLAKSREVYEDTDTGYESESAAEFIMRLDKLPFMCQLPQERADRRRMDPNLFPSILANFPHSFYYSSEPTRP